MGAKGFLDELARLGHKATLHDGNRITFPYSVPVGRFASQQLRMGLTIGDDFPTTCPSGPHISPPLLAIHPSNDLPHPAGGVHDSDYSAAVGGQWQYWSRPLPGWGQSDRTVRAYMAHIRALFATQ
jgi:hypothetical protein